MSLSAAALVGTVRLLLLTVHLEVSDFSYAFCNFVILQNL